MHWASRREKFREIINGDTCVHPGSVFDPLSARITEDAGYEVGMLAGSVASMAVLGAPDLIVLTLSEFAGLALRINRAGNLPLMVDADHGYGNALNVRRTVEELETAGVAGLSIEDTDLPQPFGSVGTTKLIPIEEGVGKMRAALDARQDPSLVIAGRSSAVAVTGVDDAIARGLAYQDAGVDVMFYPGVKSRDELDPIAEALDIPIFLGGTPAELADKEYLASRGVRIALQGHLPFMASVKAAADVIKALREGTAPTDITTAAPGDLMKAARRDGDYDTWMEEFLS